METNIAGMNGNGMILTNRLSHRSDYLRTLKAAQDGEIVKIRHGVYARPQILFNTMIDVETIVPNGIVCLYSAWYYYQLSSAIPPSICVAIDSKRKIVLTNNVDITLYYWKKENLEFGITNDKISGYNVLITDIERSVCDAIKYRNKIGIEVCAEIVKNYLRRKDRNISRLMGYAKKLRVAKTLTTYLEIAL